MVSAEELAGGDLRCLALFGHRYQEIPLSRRQQLLVLSEHYRIGLQYLHRSLLDKGDIHPAARHIIHRVAQTLSEICVSPCPVEDIADGGIVNAKSTLVEMFCYELGIDLSVELL